MVMLADFIPSGANGAAVAGSATGITIPPGGGGTLLYDTSYPFQPPSSVRFIGSTYGGIQQAFTAAAVVGMSWEMEIPALPTVATTFANLGQWRGGTNRVGIADVTSTGAMRIKDFNTAKRTSPDALVKAGDRVRIVVFCNPGSTTGHRLQVFIGANRYGTTADWDSGATTATGQTAVTTVDNVQVGQTPTGTLAYDIRIGRIRVQDSAADPGSGYASTPSAPAVTAAASNNQVDLAFGPAAAGQTAVGIWRHTQGVNDWALVTTLGATATTYSDTSVINGTTYQYAVRQANASGYGVAGFALASPAATSTSRVQLISDILTASASAVGATGAALASATAKPTADPSSYIVITIDGHYVGQFAAPPTPLPAGTVGTLRYVLGAGQSRNVQVTLKLASGTILAQDDPVQAPGSYTLDLPAAAIDAITTATAGGIQLDVQDLGAPVPT